MFGDMPNTVIWSKLKPEVEFQYDRRLFFQTVDEMWFADRRPRSDKSDMIKYETASSICRVRNLEIVHDVTKNPIYV